jgi:hypothetical protein
VAVLAAAGVLAAGCSDSATERTGAAPPRHASFANAPRAKGGVLVQHWQLGVATEAQADVATVSISAARATAVGNLGCQASGHATVDRRRRTNRAPSG